VLNRRSFIQGTATGAASILVLDAVGCGGKSVAGSVTIIQGAASELQVLFPNNPALGKIVSLANDFSKDWSAGNFASARTAFDNLDTEINQVITDLGLNASTRIKLILAALGIGLRAVAAIISEQGQSNPAASRAARDAAPQTVNRVNQLADPTVADRLLKSVKP